MSGNSKDVSSIKVVASLYQTLQGHHHAVLGAYFSTGVGLHKNVGADPEKNMLDTIDASVKLWKIQKIRNPRTL